MTKPHTTHHTLMHERVDEADVEAPRQLGVEEHKIIRAFLSELGWDIGVVGDGAAGDAT
jgi:hypothetical protein